MIHLGQNIIGQIIFLVEPQIGLQIVTRIGQLLQHRIERRRPPGLLRRLDQRLLFPVVEGSAPIHVCSRRGHPAAFQEAFQLVLESDLVVGYRPVLSRGQKRLQHAVRQSAGGACQQAGTLHQVAAKQLISAFPTERHGRSRFRQAGEEPYRQGAGIGVGLVAIISELVNRAWQVLLGVEIEFGMFGSVLLHHLAHVARLIETAPAKSDGKCFEARTRSLGCVMHQAGGIQAAAEPDTQRHIRFQMFPYRLLQQAIQFRLGRLSRPALGASTRQAPVTLRPDRTAPPL